MKANAIPLLAIFEKKMRLEVPLFQRQYVWNREQQWEPLWEDIQRKFTEYLEGRKDAPVHFLGAMVLDQKQTPTTHVEKRQVIDGQQRLTTLQIFLAAFRDFCRLHGCEELGKECEGFTLNKGMMVEPQVERFKVWPTQADRNQFNDVILAGSLVELEKKHPLVRRKFARQDDPRPRMVEAYVFLHERLVEFFNGRNGEPPLRAEVPLSARLEECFQALKNALQVVAIDLESGDDAQVIFETLNARGEPLLPADLLRNFIFLRAARHGESQEQLYAEYWKQFDDPFWRDEVRQGRLSRPRSDLFMQHFLSSRQCVDIPVKHLFVEYKFWISKENPFDTVREELATLAKQGTDFRRLIAPEKTDLLYPLMKFMDAFEIRTAYPLLLSLLDQKISDEALSEIATILESYLLRRAVCDLDTKNYNRIFLQLTKSLRSYGPTPKKLRDELLAFSGKSTAWPTDDEFSNAWLTTNAYSILNNPRIVHILSRISAAMLTGKQESLQIESALTVEHLMPQHWIPHWPLQDGSTGMNDSELLSAYDDDPRKVATETRTRAIQTFGNLTIITQPLNSAVSNGPWNEKQPALLQYSLLPINSVLASCEVWDESAILNRSRALLALALKIWPRA